VNARRQWHNEYRVGALVTVPSIQRNDNNRPSSLFGWISGQLDEPDFASKWNALSGIHLSDLIREFAQCKLPPLNLFLCFCIGNPAIIIRDRFLNCGPFLLTPDSLEDFLKNGGS